MRNPASHILPITAVMTALLAQPPATAAPVHALSAQSLYVRARAAEAGGDPRAASEGFAALMAREPTNTLLAQRAYTQAIQSGDEALAVRAARSLDKLGALRPDGRLLLALQAVRAGNWAEARAGIDKVEQERLFNFLVPMLRAWIAVGAHDADPLVVLEPAKDMAIAQPYYTEQRALLLIALGKREEGVSALRASSLNRPLPTRLRLIAAQALAAERQKDRALALLEGDDPTIAAARAIITSGKKLPAPIDTPAAGAAALLVRVASDFGQQRLVPIGFTFGRFATFLAPQDASAWLVTADLLGTMRQLDGALDALSHIENADPLEPTSQALRVALLNQLGNREAALAEALKAAQAPGAGTAAWSRVGDVSLSLQRPAEAAKAYLRALDLADAAKSNKDQLWPLWLQYGAALDLAGDWAESKTAMQKALDLAPDQAMVLNQLGYSQIAHRENVDKASGLIERASRLRPDDPAITDSLGWVYYLRGNVTDAVPLLERAAAGDPTEPTINEHLGDAYWTSGRLYEARYAWRAALVTAEEKDKTRLSTKIDLGLSEATASP
jgi:tetratricopeptide (TPR) repeat protein